MSGVAPKPQLSDPELAALALAVGFDPRAIVPGDTDTEAVVAVAVALAENGGRTQTVSRTNDVGVWQINMPAHQPAHPDWTASWLKDPVHNGEAAIIVSGGGTNWRPWTTYRRGLDRPFRARARAAVAEPANSSGFGVTVPGGFGASVGPDGVDVQLGPLDALGQLGDELLKAETWKRLGLVLGGVLLVLLGVAFIARDTLTSGQLAGAALNLVPGGAIAKKVL